MPKPPILERELLERLERLALQWQRSFQGLVGGHNLSRSRGGGLEFLDHRTFHPGDDLRSVNWRAYMRLDTLLLKLFQVEPRVPVRLLLDNSRSMGAGNGKKFEYAKRLAAAICYVGMVRLDMIRVLPFSGGLQQGIACGGGRTRFAPLSDFLANLNCDGKSDFRALARQFADQHPQRGLVIIVSDFLDDLGCDESLRNLALHGNELSLIHVWADEDRTPRLRGQIDFRDAETDAQIRLNVDEAICQRYTEAFDRFAFQIRTLAAKHQGKYAGIPTSTPIEDAVFGPLLQSRAVS